VVSEHQVTDGEIMLIDRLSVFWVEIRELRRSRLDLDVRAPECPTDSSRSIPPTSDNSAPIFFCSVVMLGSMPSCQGDFFGKRCTSGKRSGDVYNDYLDILNGVVCDDSQIRWRLVHMVTYDEYESWERHMQDGFYRCDTYEYSDNPTRMRLALRRVDEE